MRIIAGLAKGIKLKAVKGLKVRPTADRIKESVFNILENINVGNYLSIDSDSKIEYPHAIYQAKTLDLFAGTGNLGLEALSRGAKSAVFVDKNPASLSVINENILAVKMPHICEVIKSDVFSALDKMKKEGYSFNLAFADPPYEQGFAARIVNSFDDSNLLEPGGILLVEHSKNELFDCAEWKKLSLVRSQQYGQTVISFFINNNV